MIQRTTILKYAVIITVALLIAIFILKRSKNNTEKFEDADSSVIGNLKDTIDGILARQPADNIDEDDEDDEDEEDDDEEDDDEDLKVNGSA